VKTQTALLLVVVGIGTFVVTEIRKPVADTIQIRKKYYGKPKSGEGKPTEFWSPNFLGRFYQSAVTGERESQSGSTQRLHWRRGHIKSQPHGPRH
jgi:hypothetical protein